ncbi:6-phosphogluconolactonase, partial [Klebsiella pneumoniae]
MKQTVYTASPESQQIHVWSLEADGKLTLVQVVDAPGQVQPMVVSPNKEFLYVGVRPEFRVLAYRITPDNGALTFAGEAALPGSPTHISTDRHGRFVFSASYNQGCVSVTPLHDGLPGETITVVEGLEGCHSANISPDNRTLWVPALKQDRICLFTLSDDGFLSAQEPAEVTTVEGAGPRHMVFHPNQQYGYCVNELNSSIDVWELKDPKGNIECVQTLDMMPPDFSGVRWAADIHITPDGRHLYACDRTAS